LQRPTGLNIVLTLRHDGLRNHPGEVSFPGGRVEQGEPLLTAALRETSEEIGLLPEDVEVWGQLDRLYVPPSNFMVQPFTAFVRDATRLMPSSPEVERIIEMPLERLFEPEAIGQQQMYDRMVDYYEWQGSRVWGATARMINNLAEALGQPCDATHARMPPASATM
jgi:8-oxo-dGTP pyrophosphatase MutT (NUDIX family)